MSFIKKNLLFCIFVALCVVVSLVGAFLALSGAGNLKKAQESSSMAESQLEALLGSAPAPTKENLELAERNLSELQAALAQNREDLQSGSALSLSQDGVSVMAGIQQYIFKFQNAVRSHVNEVGEPAPIETPEDFAFGFQAYIDESMMLEDGTKVALLDKQRQILSYLLTQLMAAGPQSIDVVKREILESQANSNAQAFTISPAISARVPGAIDTMAFSLTFSGYTDVLREFLNSLSRFDLPIVVRSIEVKRPSGSETVVAPTRRNDAANFLDLFGSGGDTTTKEQSDEAQKPVIEENISQFTVIVEFIEVVLPDSKTQEVSDPA